MRLPAWFSSTKKSASTPPTTEELEAKVVAAEQAHTAAVARVEAARADLATDRSEGAAQALREAKAEVEDVVEMLAILRADHGAALERAAAVRREQELAQAEAEGLALTVRDEEQSLLREENEAWRRLIDVRLKRDAAFAARERRMDAYRSLCNRLELDPAPIHNSLDVPFSAREALRVMAREAELAGNLRGHAVIHQLARL